MVMENQGKYKSTGFRQHIALFFTLGTLSLVAIMSGIYAISTTGDNKQNLICAQSEQLTDRIRPFATGDMAALKLSSNPKPLPATVFIDDAAVEHRFSEWRGKIILVNLWATWCAPCREEMPDLQELQQTLGGPSFEVVALNIDMGGPDKGKAFYADNHLTDLAYYHDTSGRAFRDVSAFGVPTTLLIGRDGCEAARLTGPARWMSADALRLLRLAIDNKYGTFQNPSDNQQDHHGSSAD